MAKFKVGDKVRATCDKNSPYSITFKGWEGVVVEVGEAEIRVKGKDIDGSIVVSPKYIELIKKGDIMTIEKAKFALIYERDQDPIEYFKTEKQALKKIEELLEDGSVQKNSIYLVTFATKQKVKVNNFSLEEV